MKEGINVKRKIMEELIEWKNKINKLPLILYGARQVGKTYILKEFAQKYYADYVYVNFEQMNFAKEIFEKELIPDKIILQLERYLKSKIIPEQTLIILDEIQVCERALTSLKYFAEQANDYHIVAAGSLLGVAINREKYSFPVGKVEMLNLFPLDFEEFLWEIDGKSLSEDIRENVLSGEPLLSFQHEEALELYRTYLVTGGMPAVVLDYSKNRNFENTRQIQENIINSYISDMAKYATASETTKIRIAYESLPVQLAKENKKFQFKLLKKGASVSNFGVALDWLELAKIIIKCKKVEQIKKPLEGYIDLSSFKLYAGDIGLLTYKAGLTPEDLMVNSNEINEYRGGITENYVAQALLSNKHSLYYWESDGKAEIDFVIVKDNKIIPVEVKSNDNVRSRSISIFCQRFAPEYSIRISSKNIGIENNIKSIPLYAVFCI